jgi:ATP-dependent Clp protease ATP-binding subunit ClpC
MDALSAESDKVLAIARHEAAGLRHEFTGTEHILLGLLACDDEIAAPLLSKHGIVAVEVRTQVARPGSGRDDASENAQPLTARAKQVLTLASREAEQLDDLEVGPEHLLLGIIRQASGVAALVLTDMGVDLVELRDEVLEARAGRERLFDQDRFGGGPGSSGGPETPSSEASSEGSRGDGEVVPTRVLAPPLCPKCGERLADVLATMSVASPGAGTSGRRRPPGNVTLVYCGACGHTISATR